MKTEVQSQVDYNRKHNLRSALDYFNKQVKTDNISEN